MKRTTFILFVAIAFVFSSCSIFKGGSKSFEGKITYEITYPDADLEPAQKAQMPKQSVTYVMGNYAKSVTNQGSAEIVQIIDGEAKTKTIMIAGGGMKKYHTLKEEQIKAQNSDVDLIGLEKTDETKEIAGYTTKKAVAKYENDYGETETLTMYYTPEIGNKSINFDNPFMKEIDGMVLEYELKQGDMITKYTANSIEKTNLKETDFLVPDDYEKLTDEELEQLRGAGQ
ncbi:MAG: hypothetical protein ACQESM_09995 [Bacteroidota bacterium]